jgi:hypothetical protein
LVPTKHPLCVGPGDADPVGDGHGTGELPPVEMRQPGDGLEDDGAVGDGQGLGPFGVDTRQVGPGDGACVGLAVGVGHGTGELPPVPTRHEGDGLGAMTAAPGARVWPPPSGSADFVPPPPAQAAVSVTMPRIKPSRRKA